MYKWLVWCLFFSTGILVSGSDLEKVWGDFEDAENSALWLKMKAPRDDCREAEKSISQAYKTSGSNSLKAVFKKHTPRLKPYVILAPSVDNFALSITDWTTYKRLLFDVYNPQDKTIRLILLVWDSELKRLKVNCYLKPGQWNHVSVDLSDLKRKRLNPAKIACVNLVMSMPDKDYVFYFDNFRLSTRPGGAWKMAADSLTLIPPPLEKMDKSLNAILPRLEEIKRVISGRHGEYGESFDAVKQLRNQLCDNSIAAITNFGIPESQGSGVELSAVNFKRQNAILNLSYFADKIASALAEKKLLSRITGQSPDSALVFGKVVHPDVDNIAYSPRTYNGPLLKSVRINAAGNETRSACLLVIPAKTALKNLIFKVSELKSGRSSIPVNNVMLCPLAYRRDAFRENAFAYLLRPDIKSVDVPLNVQQGFWLNITVPGGTPAGVYTGQAIFKADGIKPHQLEIKLRVYNFSIPSRPTLPIAVHSPSSITVNKDAEDIMKHRCEPGSIYTWKNVPDVERVKFWVDNGAQMAPLLRISAMGSKIWKKDADGKIIDFSDKRKNVIFKKLRAVVPEIKKAGLLDKCYVYGFDEPSPACIPAMNKVFGDLKKEFGLRTMFTTYQPIWEYHEIKNADIWGVSYNLLTPERIAEFQGKGRKVFSYNMATSGQRGKLQFWSAFKSGIDGMLQYKLNAAADQTPKTEFPLVNAKLGSVRMPDLAGMKNYNNIAFEMWREGSEDYEYLHLLRLHVKKLEKDKKLATKHAELLFKAKALLYFVNETILPINKYYPANFESISLEEIDKLRSQIAKVLEQMTMANL